MYNYLSIINWRMAEIQELITFLECCLQLDYIMED